jgi:hypothetical protein
MRSRSYLGAYLRRQRSRLRAPKAITATAHKLARTVYHLMRYGMAYVKQTEAAYAEQVRGRLERQLQHLARELGYELKKIEPAAAPPVEQVAVGRCGQSVALSRRQGRGDGKGVGGRSAERARAA